MPATFKPSWHSPLLLLLLLLPPARVQLPAGSYSVFIEAKNGNVRYGDTPPSTAVRTVTVGELSMRVGNCTARPPPHAT